MKTTMNYLRISFLLLALFIGSCSKEGTEGPMGPPGKDGAVGATGTDGIQGEQGEPGEGGNANIIASEWLPIELATTTPTHDSRFAITAPEIAGENMSSAVVIVYGRHTSENYVIALPFVYRNESYQFVLSSGEIHLLAQTIDATANGTFQLFDEIRYVLIPSNNTSTSSKEATLSHLKQAGVDINDYRQVRDYYGLGH